MTILLKALAVAIIAGLLSVTLEKTVPGISLLLAVVVPAMVLLLSMSILEPIVSFLHRLGSAFGVSGMYTAPLIKCLAIALVTRLGVSLCKDAKQSGAAGALELVGSFASLYAALPLLEAFLSMMEGLL